MCLELQAHTSAVRELGHAGHGADNGPARLSRVGVLGCEEVTSGMSTISHEKALHHYYLSNLYIGDTKLYCLKMITVSEGAIKNEMITGSSTDKNKL